MGDGGFVAPMWQKLRGSGLDTGAGCNFVQQRIALFAKLVAMLGAGFFVINLVVNVILFKVPVLYLLSMPGNIAHSIGIFIITALWLVSRGGCFQTHILGTLDAIGLVGCCAAWAGIVTPGEIGTMQPALMAVTLTTMARAIIVPSKPGRTLRLTFLSFAPLLVVGWWWAQTLPVPSMMQSRFAFTVGVVIDLVLWATAVITTATVTSRVIYGLRQTAREANELGQYTLEEKLGVGGMGEVWRAHHRMLVRPAAVKLIRPEPLMSGRGSSEVLLRRFEREARATASLRSPHTVQLYDFGQAEDGTLYYVMEMLVGLDLDKLVSRFGPVPAERAIHILKQVCHSLDEAHRNGLTHRDVKPANVFVSRIGTELDFAKVLDFGLVRLKHDRPGSGDVKLTADGSASGTPAYMAPEIVMGDANYDHRVDIYAVGCVGYWLLTGKMVFEGDNAMKVMMDHARTTPPRPQTRTELPIPPELEQIIMDCLEKDRERRPASAAELARRLAACKTAEEWTVERAERWWQTHLPSQTIERPVAEVLLSREGASPPAWRELRPRHRNADLR